MGAKGVAKTVGTQGKREARVIEQAAATAKQATWLSEYWWVALGGVLVLVLLVAERRRA
jgi:hypothetical protein